eukprot:3409650-Rhodomonas_salina.2
MTLDSQYSKTRETCALDTRRHAQDTRRHNAISHRNTITRAAHLVVDAVLEELRHERQHCFRVADDELLAPCGDHRLPRPPTRATQTQTRPTQTHTRPTQYPSKPNRYSVCYHTLPSASYTPPHQYLASKPNRTHTCTCVKPHHANADTLTLQGNRPGLRCSREPPTQRPSPRTARSLSLPAAQTATRVLMREPDTTETKCMLKRVAPGEGVRAALSSQCRRMWELVR